MAATIFLSSRDHERDVAIATARASASASEVAERFDLQPASVRKIIRRVKREKSWELFLVRNGEKPVALGTFVTDKGFTAAALGAYRHCGMRGLELPGWRVVASDGSCNTLETLRKIIARTDELVTVSADQAP